MAYYYVLAVHIIFVVSWMAGLFYSVRLFITQRQMISLSLQDKSLLRSMKR